MAQEGAGGAEGGVASAVSSGSGESLSVGEWRCRKAKLDGALAAAVSADCPDAAEALRRRVQELGPAPEVPKPPPSPWATAQRARRHVTKAHKLHVAAVATQEAAADAAARAAEALSAAEARLSEAAARLEEARRQEAEALAALAAAPAPHGDNGAAADASRSTGALAEVARAIAVGGKLDDPRVADALEILRGALGTLGADAPPDSTIAARTAMPKRAPWADADGLAAGGDSDVDDELDDAWADSVSASAKRSCPESELNSVGVRCEDAPAEGSRASRCRRMAAPETRAAGGVETLRAAVVATQGAVTSGDAAALGAAASRLVSELEGGAAMQPTAPPPLSAAVAATAAPHPVFVAVGSGQGQRQHEDI